MRRRDDVLVVDERSAAERLGVEVSRAVAEGQAHLPRVLVLLGGHAADDAAAERNADGDGLLLFIFYLWYHVLFWWRCVQLNGLRQNDKTCPKINDLVSRVE